MKFRDSRGSVNYEIPVSNGLLTPEHVKRMGDAIWLELLLEDMVNDGEGDDGIVAGGNAVLDHDLATRLGKSEKTIARYRRALQGAYILARRASQGHTYRVLKSKKWAVIQRARLDKSVRSPRPLTGQKCPIRSDTTGGSYKETTSVLHQAVAGSPWSEIGIPPCGPPAFQELVLTNFTNPDGHGTAEVMGRCLDDWDLIRGRRPRPALFCAALERLRGKGRAGQAQERAAGKAPEDEIPLAEPYR